MALRRALVRLGDASSCVTPQAPPGTGVIFHSRLETVKYALNHQRYFMVVGSGLAGALCGNFFYKKLLMSRNPPNPPRHPDDVAPEKHMHELDEDEDDD